MAKRIKVQRGIQLSQSVDSSFPTDFPRTNQVEDQTNFTNVPARLNGPRDMTSYEEAVGDSISTSKGNDIKGRSWPDIVHPYSSNAQYLYLIIPALFYFGLGMTGNLKSLDEFTFASLGIIVCWTVLGILRWKSRS